MGKFTGADVDDLGYDFTKILPEPIPEIEYTPGPHSIPEPSSTQIVAYFGAYGSLMRSNAQQTQRWQDKLDRIDASADGADDQRDQVTADYEKWASENAERTLTQRRQLLAGLCSHQPSDAILERLPGRWFDAFEEYLQEELTGGKGTSATNA